MLNNNPTEWRQRVDWIDKYRFTYRGRPGTIQTDWERLRMTYHAGLENYMCSCDKFSLIYRGGKIPVCAVCKKMPRHRIYYCHSCRKPYLRDFATKEWEGLDKYKRVPAHHYCWDCNTDEVTLKRQVVVEVTAEDLEELGLGDLFT